MPVDAVMTTDLSGVTLHSRGKVRDIYDLGDSLLIIATDRLSAFDVVMPTPIPDKGHVLTGLSLFWCDRTSEIIENHLLTADVADYPAVLQPHAEMLAGRSMVVRKASVLPVECVVRGYLAGSGWKEYQQSGAVCGIALPAGMKKSEKLPQPIFTPATKAVEGHDINITRQQAAELVGEEILSAAESAAVRLYTWASGFARERGIILADTKFEFGVFDGRLIVVDEMFTPDSSRFWDARTYEPGRSQDSFDKQFVRDWLESIHWNKQPPAPELPLDVVEGTRRRYLEAYERICGRALKQG